MSSFISEVNEGELSVSGDNQRFSNYGYDTRCGPFNTHAKYHCFKLEHTVVMNIWNIVAWQRQKYLTSAESCYFMSLSDKSSYLHDSIMLLSQIIATIISTVKYERNNIPFTIDDIFKGEFNWNMFEITPPSYAIKHVYSTDYVLNNMVFLRRILLDTLIQNFIMLRHLVDEISRVKFDDYRVIRTGARDLKLFVGGVHMNISSRVSAPDM